jgi:hypothetical protein
MNGFRRTDIHAKAAADTSIQIDFRHVIPFCGNDIHGTTVPAGMACLARFAVHERMETGFDQFFGTRVLLHCLEDNAGIRPAVADIGGCLTVERHGLIFHGILQTTILMPYFGFQSSSLNSE